MTWRIELSPTAVATLRALTRGEQRRIAERIKHLEAGGLPPAARSDDAGPVGIPAADHLLMCVEDGEAHRILIVTISASRVPARRAVGTILRRWMKTMMGGGGMETMVQDLSYALRSLRKSPAFSLLAVITLALGVGAATAIFSVANGVLLEPMPYEDPDEVVSLWATWDNFPDKTWLAVDEFQLIHQESRALEDAGLYYLTSANFTSVENPERVGAAGITPNTLPLLGVEPMVGRVFTWDEARDSIPPVLISHEAWQRRWGADRTVVGSAVEIDGQRLTVIGVTPPGFVLPADYPSTSPAEIFIPYYVDVESPAPDLGTGGSHGLYGVGRLADGHTVESARDDMERIWAQSVQPVGMYSPERRFGIRVFGSKDDVVGSAKGTILLLLGAVTLVLLIACGNVANLLLARAESRTGEVAVRAALGAGRARILRQLLTESAVLALLGGGLGILVANFGVRTLLAIDPNAVPRAETVSMDTTVLLFAVAASVLTALLFGVAPALRMVRQGGAASLHDGSRGGSGPSTRLQGLLVGSQMAMAVILLAAGGLTIRTFVNLLEVDPGFGEENVLTFRITAPAATYPETEDVVTFYQEVLRRMEELPGVRQAGAGRILPLVTTMGDAGVNVEGYVRGDNESTQGEWQWATPGYFEIMGIPLMAGRTFERGDIEGNQEAIVINQSLARHYFGDGDPLGATITTFGEPATVVGVVGDVAHNGLTGSVKDRFYRPHAQVNGVNQRSMTITLATEADPQAMVAPARALLRQINPALPMSQVRTLDEVMASSVAQPRFAMVLLGSFGSIALLLAIVGIYGVISYSVSRRTREIGIRMALGAEAGQVVGLMVRQGMAMAVAGVVVGIGFALALTRFMQGMLYGVEPQDVTTFTVVPALFALVALVACWVPAARAARVQPSRALREE